MNQRVTHKNRGRGFTLLEVMIALGILSVIMGTVYGSYRAITDSLQRVAPQSAQQRQAVSALNRLCRHLRCCYAGPARADGESPAAPAERLGPASPPAAAFVSRRSGAGHDLRFVTAQVGYRGSEPCRGLYEVHYAWDASTGVLQMRQRPYLSLAQGPDRRAAGRPLCARVLAWDMAFYDGHAWVDAWGGDPDHPVPRAVRVQLTVGERESEGVTLCATVALNGVADTQATRIREDRRPDQRTGKGAR